MTWSQTLAALTLFAAACHPSADEGAHGAADTDTVVELRPDGRDLLELQAATTEPLGGRVDHGMPVTLTVDVLLIGASTDPLTATLDFCRPSKAGEGA